MTFLIGHFVLATRSPPSAKTHKTLIAPNVAIVFEIVIIISKLLGVHLIRSIDKWHSNQKATTNFANETHVRHTFRILFKWISECDVWKTPYIIIVNLKLAQQLARVKNGILLAPKLNKTWQKHTHQEWRWRRTVVYHLQWPNRMKYRKARENPYLEWICFVYNLSEKDERKKRQKNEREREKTEANNVENAKGCPRKRAQYTHI